MPENRSDVDIWLSRETEDVRKALESASRYFDDNDSFTVNTLESIYAQESSFGIQMGERGSTAAAGHFQFEPATAKRYGLEVSVEKDERFDIVRSASAAARYLKDLNGLFSQPMVLAKNNVTVTVENAQERKKFALAAFNAGEGRISKAQNLAEISGKNPTAMGRC